MSSAGSNNRIRVASVLLVLYRRTEITDRIKNILLFIADWAHVERFPLFDPEPTREGGADRVSGKFQDEHAKSADKIIEEPVERGVQVGNILRASFPAETSFRDHPEKGEEEVMIGERGGHAEKCALPVHEKQPMMHAEELFQEEGANGLPVGRGQPGYFVLQPSADDLQVVHGIVSDLPGKGSPELATRPRTRDPFANRGDSGKLRS
jgi:hypothetical protein